MPFFQFYLPVAPFIGALRIPGATQGNLSVQLTKLEEWGYLTSQKVIEQKKTKSTYTITFQFYLPVAPFIGALRIPGALLSSYSTDKRPAPHTPDR